MGFSLKRAKAVKEGRVRYCIYNGDKLVFSTQSFMVAIQTADAYQKSNPDIPYTMKLEEIPPELGAKNA